MLTIEYSVNIIVGVMYHAKWEWYVSEKEDWFMDRTKFRQGFVDAGYSSFLGSSNESERFGIPILDQSTASQFFKKMEKSRVNKDSLNKLIRQKFPVTCWDDIAELVPSLFIDFDKHQLKSLFPEPASFEDFVPDGWKGEYSDFLDEIPEDERYWIIDGVDTFKLLIS